MTWHNDDIICFCQEIRFETIKNALNQGAKTVEDIIDLTDAGIACGTCIEELEQIVLDHNRAIERKR